ncbi:MAG: ammonia-forming cytochrome c nitrite reductase subunit c552 [ANME-2 cluster archaeon]|nr:ammonia-forming cytochrome c nitrite reductase subunit c552 [ANME-2 cluster archaeon]
MNKGIILGMALFLILLALTGTGSARNSFGVGDCPLCHIGYASPITPDELTAAGNNFNETHRMDASTIEPPDCTYCHVDASSGNFALKTGTPTYLTSTTCENCHKAKYDMWYNTLHRVMLTPNDTAEAMGLPLPPATMWGDISYVIVTKFELAYIDTFGYFLGNNDAYETEHKVFGNSSHVGGAYGTCGRCHTTGWNGSEVNDLPGINGTFAEPGIGCERCHGAAGNGHQITVEYSADLCMECHGGGRHGTGWENGGHAPPAARTGDSCTHCHSPFDKYKGNSINETNATNVACGVCHNIHDMTDSKYAETFSDGIFNSETWSEVADSKLSFFNATASLEANKTVFDDLTSNVLLYAGNDSSRKDASYGTDPINLTGRPVSDVLCSKCHYRHGLAHMAGVNASHATLHGDGAACIDCHMAGASAEVGKDMMMKHGGNDPLDADSNSCGGVTRCHTTSAQNLNNSTHSVVPVINEWNASAHNVKYVGVGDDGYNHFYGHINVTTGGSDELREASCNKCHDPINWDPDDDYITTEVPLDENFKGVACITCHNFHDMGNWLAMTQAAFGEAKGYAWYNVDAVTTSHGYKAGYQMVESTTELCGNCHASVRIGRSEPGWSSDNATRPNRTHGFPALDLFVGSYKETTMGFECIDCHMASMVENSTGSVLPDSQKVKGHSFKVNATLLQTDPGCSSCHETGSILGNISTTIEDIQTAIEDKWNTTNQTVEEALAAINAYEGEKGLSRELIAEAYWNKQLVSSDESWGVHNPAKVNQLLDDAVRLANEANASLGQGSEIGSSVSLMTGWNLVSLKSTPDVTSTDSVMNSVKDNISVVWGFNATVQDWEIYDPLMPAVLNSLKEIVPGKGYWILAKEDCEWTV